MTDDLDRMAAEGGIAPDDKPERTESEKQIMHKIMVKLSAAGARVFRNTVGMAYQGKALRFREPAEVHVEPGDIVIRQARTVRAGLITGSSDLVGWHSRLIDEYDLGKRIAVFLACEVKTSDGRLEPEQAQFLKVVDDAGGIAMVARCEADAIAKLNNGEGIDDNGDKTKAGRV